MHPIIPPNKANLTWSSFFGSTKLFLLITTSCVFDKYASQSQPKHSIMLCGSKEFKLHILFAILNPSQSMFLYKLGLQSLD